MHKKQQQVQSSQIGFNGLVRVNDLIDIIQDVEKDHIEGLTLLSKSSKEDNFAIILNYRFVKIHKKISFPDILKMETFPYQTKAFYGFRNSIIYNEKNELVVSSYCLGSFINLETLSPHRLTKEVLESIVDEPRFEMVDMGRKINFIKSSESIKESIIEVQKSYIDYYQHVNNAYYVEFAYNQLPIEIEFNTLICEYKQAFLLGDKMTLKTFVNNNEYLVEFYNDKNELSSLIHFLNT